MDRERHADRRVDAVDLDQRGREREIAEPRAPVLLGHAKAHEAEFARLLQLLGGKGLGLVAFGDARSAHAAREIARHVPDRELFLVEFEIHQYS